MAGYEYGGGGMSMPGNRYLQLLAQQPDTNNGTLPGGISSMLQKALMGYMMGQDQRDETQANQAFTQGMSAKPWVNPDTGDATMANAQGKMVPTGPAGGLEGAMSALSGMQGNPYAGRMTQSLMMKKAETDTATQAAIQKLQLEDQLARRREAEKPIVAGAGSQVIRPGQQPYQVPAKPERPQHITTAEGVFEIGPDGSLGRRLGAAPSQANAGPSGPFGGTGLESQVLNILLKGDTASPEYQAAYNHQSDPKQIFDPATRQVVTITPNMSAFRPPASMVAATPTQPAPQPQASPQPPQQNNQGGVTVAPAAGAGPSAAQQKDITTALTGAATIVNALEEFRDQSANAGSMRRVKSVAGINTPLNTSFNIAALMAKGQELFDLGVLNGPDLDMIRRTLPDPSTFGSAIFTDSTDVDSAIKQITDVIQTKISSKMRGAGMPDININDYAKTLRQKKVEPPTEGLLPPLPPGFQMAPQR